MFNTFFNMVIKDIKLLMRNKQLMIISFAFPFIVFFIFSFVFSDLMQKKPVIEPFKVAVVDYEHSNLTGTLIDNFKNYKSFSKFVTLEVVDITKAKQNFSENKLTAIVEIPSNFSTSLYYCENAPLKVTINEKEPLKSTVFKNLMESYGKFVSSVEAGAYTFNSSIKQLNLPPKETNKYIEQFSLKLILSSLDRGSFFERIKYEDIPSSSSIQYFLFSISLVFIMYIGLTAGTFIIHEKNNGCLQRLKASPIAPLQIIFSKCFAFSIFAFNQAIIFTIPIALICKLDLTYNLGNLLLFLIVEIFFIVSFAILSSTFFKAEEASVLFGNMFIFILAIVGGSFIPLQLMPPMLQKISMATPNYWLIKGFLCLSNYHSLYSQRYIILTLITLTIIFLSTAAYKIKLQKRC